MILWYQQKAPERRIAAVARVGAQATCKGEDGFDLRTVCLVKGNYDPALSDRHMSGKSSELMMAEETFQRQTEFMSLLADLAARFAGVPAEEIESEIGDWQRRVCDFLDLDCSTLWLASEEDPGTMILQYIYQATGGPQVLGKLDTPGPFPWSLQKLLDGETLVIKGTPDLAPESAGDPQNRGLCSAGSTLVIPMFMQEKGLFGVLSFGMIRNGRSWTDITVQGLRLAVQVFGTAFQQAHCRRLLAERLREIGELRRRMESRDICLREELQVNPVHFIVGRSAVIRNTLMQVGRVAPTDSTVLIMGETGTGKELLARAIHSISLRSDRPFVTVNCASLPPTLIESELFGREKGAYTGAMTKMIGRFESADGGTLFLDEVGELPLELQSKFLRVLEHGVFERLGSTRPMHVNMRLIAATNRDLADDIRAGRFRKDLYYRLNVFPITVPPLRERAGDIPLLVWTIVNEFQEKMGKRIETISKKSMQAMQAYPWPGNVRELRNVIERAMIVAPDEHLDIAITGSDALGMTAEEELPDVMEDQKLDRAERKHILRVLEKSHWRVTGKGSAAEILGLKRSTLQSKMKKLGIKRPLL